MASWGTVFLLLTVLTAALTRDTASQDLRAPEHGQKSLLVAEGVQEAREARGKEVEVPEEVKAKRILKKKKKMKKEEKKGDQKSEEKKKKRRKKVKGGKKGDLKNKEKRRKKVKKEGKRGNQKNGEKKKRRRRKKVKKEGKGGDQKNGEKKRKKRKGMARKACPGGQCVPSAEQCGDGRAVRAATCKSGVCCVTASKKKGEKGDARGKKKKKKCKPRNPCKKVWGKCASKKKGCPSGQTMLVSTKEIKYCSKKNCVCCTDEVQQPACVSKKCAKKKGFCTTDKSECSGKIKVQKNFCSGANCVCCLPAKQCKIQKDCLDLGGTCVDMKKSEECKTKPLVGKNYCKGKCGCCVPEGPFKWGYTEENGPAIWPEKFPMCGGKRQSPVALVSKDALGTNPWIPFKFENYRETPTTQILINNGHTAMVMVEQEKPPVLRGGDLEGPYNFLQYHFHWGKDSSEGSEHTIDGRVWRSSGF